LYARSRLTIGAGASGARSSCFSISASIGPSFARVSDGEVRKIDKSTGKITLRHGPIPSLDMPEMTMVFRVRDPAMLDHVEAGDKIRFTADKIGGQYTVVSIEKK